VILRPLPPRRRGLILPTFAGAAADPQWANVILMLAARPGIAGGNNSNGPDANQTFTDQSAVGRTITFIGSVAWETTTLTPPSGLASYIEIGATNSNVRAAAAADLALGTGDFVVEMYYRTTSAVRQFFFEFQNAGAMLRLEWTGTQWESLLDAQFIRGGALNTTGWEHLAVSRTAGTFYLHVGGALVGSVATARNYNGATPALWIAGSVFNILGITGGFAGFRLTKGHGRGYTGATITPPPLPLLRG
jgi:hypothetical protein